MEKKEKKIIESQGSNEVILHQNVARLRGTLTPVQSRSMLSIIKRANEEIAINPDTKEFTIDTKLFLDDIQSKDTSNFGTVVNKLESHLRILMTKTFEWGTEKERNICVFIQQIKITKEKVTFKFSDYIREHIKPLSNALIIKDFVLIQSFRSEYARQLYKHLMNWNKEQACYLSIEDFKDFLGVPKTSAYDRLDNLKRKVLNVAIDEINEKCPDMQLAYMNRKKDRKVVGFNFGWYKFKPNKPSLFGEDELKSEFIDMIGKFIDGDKKILSVTPFEKGKRFRVDTPVGEYKFGSLEALRKEIKLRNN